MSIRSLAPVVLAVLAAGAFSCRHEREYQSGAIPVTIEVVKRTTFHPTLTAVGVVRAARSAPLTAANSGTIRYPARFSSGLETGAKVGRGEVIAEIRNEDLLFDQAQARLQMEAAEADFERAQRSFEHGVVSIAEHSAYRVRARLAKEAWQASIAQAARQRIVAPESGTLVVTRPVAPGTQVAAGTVIAEITSSGPPVIESAVAAADREQIRPGLRATITSGRRELGTAEIREVAAVIDRNGTARVVASVISGQIPPPGTGVELQIDLDERKDVITVPAEAVVAGAEGPSVFVSALAEGVFRQFRVRRAPVQLGGRAGGRVEIISGLQDGDRVVVAGADALSDDASVTEAGDKK